MLQSISTSLVDQEVDPLRFPPLDYSKTPLLFIGYVIKNEFDYNALKCHENAIELGHLCGIDGRIEPIFLRGMSLKPSKVMEHIIKRVCKLHTIDTNKIFNKYIKILNSYNLTCNNSYGYLMDGLYPIDIVHLQQMEDNNNTYQEYVDKILIKDDIPWYFQPELKIFILTKSNTYISKNT